MSMNASIYPAPQQFYPSWAPEESSWATLHFPTAWRERGFVPSRRCPGQRRPRPGAHLI